METARPESLWEDAQNIVNSWSYAAEEMWRQPVCRSHWEDAQHAMNSWSRAEGPTGVGPGETALLMATLTPLEIHLSQLYQIFPSRAQFLLRHLGILS